ncbi:endo-1,4-beta-xylanase [Bacteroides gallinarum]|uniref:endo-1,4-beta-xylanase n=1 Tax=Bacteroides gallinarum TaxID=376806 RepID=UPI00037AC57E|nr:endo-1,4-beta-xylanase [Bacteroides gallinarum]
MIMKNSISKYIGLVLLFVLASCADDKFVEFKTDKPESIAQYEYLNAYDALKTYIDRSTHPNFKLGAGITASEFLKGEMVRSMAIANFDEMVAGNAMKYASCVADDGTLDFSTVTKFVDAAKTAGLTVYGHTLCWHSQQNNKYLNSLIADEEIEVDPDAKEEVEDAFVDYSTLTNYTYWSQGTDRIGIENGALSVVNNSVRPNFYEVQYHIADGVPTVEGTTYKITLNIKGTSAAQITLVFGDWSNQSSTKINITDEYQEVPVELVGKSSSSFVMLQSGDFVGTIDIKSVKVSHMEAVGGVMTNVYVVEDDFSSDNMIGWGNNSTRVVNNGVMGLTNPSAVNAWETQAGYDFSSALTEGTTYFLKMKIKGSVAGSIGAAFQKVEGYEGRGDFPSISITTDWQEITVSTNCTGDAATRFLFNYGTYVGTIYLDELSIYWQKSSNSIPLTPEEKKENLTNELERWIKGMMEACGGYVTAWDVVNEPVSGGGNDGNGNYALQSATNPDDNGVGGENFYWQDFLGDDYARIPIKFARKYFAEYGGNPGDLKLFVNDYNLESWWDDNKKVKSLINWIERWESDGETKIDGIGTQMHVSYILNEDDQKKQEESIVKMFELLAASGKLIKITELDMGIVEKAFGEGIKTELVTFEQQLKMSEFYKFIIQKYFEIIPVAQQYGITQWSTTDSPADSGWRKGEPIGLWDANYNRKPTYEGFLEGLSGK